MTGTVRTMGQVGATLAYLVLLHGTVALRITGSYEAMVAEMWLMAQMCQVVALRAGIRFATR
jgi:hypothetical protein